MRGFLLALVFVFSPSAHAGLAENLKKAETLRNEAESDMNFVIATASHCTGWHSLLNSYLTPGRLALIHQHKLLVDAYSKIGEDCKIKKDVDKAINTTAVFHNEIEKYLKQMNENHETILNQFVASAGYPRCVAENRGDPASTRQAKTYVSFKKKLTELRDLLKVVHAETGKLESASACRKATIPGSAFQQQPKAAEADDAEDDDGEDAAT